MAEAAFNGVSKPVCRYFVHGVCQRGDDCSYAHDLKAKPSMICKYYKLGCCSYGDKCRYDHIKDNKPTVGVPPKSIQNGTKSERQLDKYFAAASLNTQGHSVNPAQLLPSNCTPVTSKMVTLKKGGDTAADEAPAGPVAGKLTADEWVHAAEFVPGQAWKAIGTRDSYLEAAQVGVPVNPTLLPLVMPYTVELCPYAAHSECPYGVNCQYVHGDICDLCQRAVLSPFDLEQREKHTEECVRQHQQDMELSFAVQRSKDKVCGICMDVVWEKQPATAQRFGILSSCSHCYCLDCIRKWRSAKQFENKIVRACPECRVKSDFVTPSKYWVENDEDKQKLINTYTQALSKKPCKYFDQGKGECPFNDKCFYLHAYPDGRKASPQPMRRRRRQNAEGDTAVVHHLLLWDFLEHRTSLAELGDEEDEWEDLFVALFNLGIDMVSDDDSDSESDFD